MAVSLQFSRLGLASLSSIPRLPSTSRLVSSKLTASPHHAIVADFGPRPLLFFPSSSFCSCFQHSLITWFQLITLRCHRCHLRLHHLHHEQPIFSLSFSAFDDACCYCQASAFVFCLAAVVSLCRRTSSYRRHLVQFTALTHLGFLFSSLLSCVLPSALGGSFSFFTAYVSSNLSQLPCLVQNASQATPILSLSWLIHLFLCLVDDDVQELMLIIHTNSTIFCCHQLH